MDSYDRLKPIFERYLRENRYKSTEERFIILRAVLMISSDFTIYDVRCELTRPNGEQEVSLASIYNTIKLLEDAKIVEWVPKRTNKQTYKVSEPILECV